MLHGLPVGLRVDGFVDEGRGPEAVGGLYILPVLAAAEQDDGEGGSVPLFLKTFQYAVAVHPGHVEVHHRYTDLPEGVTLIAAVLQKVGPVLEAGNLETFVDLPEGTQGERRLQGIVFDE